VQIKAAYYDPTSGVYYNYPTGRDSAPTPVASGTVAGTAVYNGQPLADIMLAGGLSPFGTMGQGGNVFEWEETDFDLVNGPTTFSSRAIRGGNSTGDEFNLRASSRGNGRLPSYEDHGLGFRVASAIPEPSTLLLSALAGLGRLCRRRGASLRSQRAADWSPGRSRAVIRS
jgi:hypothetical protein